MDDRSTAAPRAEERLAIQAPAVSGTDKILTPAALEFLLALHDRFAPRLAKLLQDRARRQERLDAGELPDFLSETAAIRNADWRVGPIPADLQDRRVEITGPTERKMVINALNSGARVFMADFEDSLTPTWRNLIEGQINLRDAVNRSIEHTTADGKLYRLTGNPAVLVVRPRGWHLVEKHVRVDGVPLPAALFDFGLYCFHNTKQCLANGSGPYFYLPKLESHREAQLWRDVIQYSEEQLGLGRGTVKVTVLIETILAAFEMDEILFALRDHIVGLNCGRWDYIFSFIKKLHRHPQYVLPERDQVTMTTHFLRSYSQLLIRTCHRRGAFAMGGMAAQIPVKHDPQANNAALAKVRADKEREAGDGHDGTWVAHPALVPVAHEVFDALLAGPNQLDRLRQDVEVTARDLLQTPAGGISEAGFRNNISVAVQYLAAWLQGNGCVPIHHLMEDAATAEIARAQLWQWIRHPASVLDDQRKITHDLFRATLLEELHAIRSAVNDEAYESGYYAAAADLLSEITAADDFVEFLTLPAYEAIISRGE